MEGTYKVIPLVLMKLILPGQHTLIVNLSAVLINVLHVPLILSNLPMQITTAIIFASHINIRLFGHF